MRPPSRLLRQPKVFDEHACLLQTLTDSLIDLAAYLSKLDVGFDILAPSYGRSCSTWLTAM